MVINESIAASQIQIPSGIPFQSLFEGLRSTINIVAWIFGGIVGIYLITLILRAIYQFLSLRYLRQIKTELKVLNKKLEDEDETKDKK